MENRDDNAPRHEIVVRDTSNEMLPARGQSYGSPPYYYGDHAEEEDGTALLLKYWHIVYRRKGTVLLFAFLGLLGAVLVTLPQTPIYQARTTIEIQAMNENFLNMKDVNPEVASDVYRPEVDIQTQIKILQSRSLLERVVNKLHLPDRAEALSPATRVSSWKKALGLNTTSEKPVSAEDMAVAAGNNLTVNAVRTTRIVEILYDSPDSRLAADFANELTSQFVDQNLEARWNSNRRTSDWLTRQIDELKIRLEKSEDEMQRYARENGLVFTDEKENVAEEKLRQVQEELSKAQADRIAKQSLYELASTTPLDALPEVIGSSLMQVYQGKLADLNRELAELSSTLTPAHYKVKRVQAQINELESVIKKERATTLQRIKNGYLTSQRREKLLQAGYAAQSKFVTDQSEKSIHYGILKREVDTSRQLYESMLQKVKEASIASALKASIVRIVDPATPPRSPYKPRIVLNSVLGLFLGLFLGVAFVFMRESADRSIRTPGDASLYLNFPELGVIPSAKLDASIYSSDRRKSLLAKNPESRLELVTWQRKPSLLAESFRSTLASMLFMNTNGNRPFVILVSSCSSGDGKSTIASNLALALAEINHRVLLIDGDLRKPRLHEIFDVDNQRGLSDLLLRREPLAACPLGEIVQETAVQDLFVLPAGGSRDSTANLLHSVRLRELINRFRDEFHTVLIDSPPLTGHLSDARILGRLSDGVILVIRAGKTTRDSILAATQRLADDGTKVLGTVLNDWNPKAAAGYGYGYGYHYKKYDGYYHYGDGKNSSK